jgi:hypothetical protein
VLNVVEWPNQDGIGQRPNRQIQQAINDNRWMASQAALLLLPSSQFTMDVNGTKNFQTFEKQAISSIIYSFFIAFSRANCLTFLQGRCANGLGRGCAKNHKIGGWCP